MCVSRVCTSAARPRREAGEEGKGYRVVSVICVRRGGRGRWLGRVGPAATDLFGSRVAGVSCDVAMWWVSESGIGMAPFAADLQTERGMAGEVPILEVQVYNGWYRGLLVSWDTLVGICWGGGGRGVCRVCCGWWDGGWLVG